MLSTSEALAFKSEILYNALTVQFLAIAEISVIYMKVRASVKKICVKCKTVKRGDRIRVICENPRHKQRQG